MTGCAAQILSAIMVFLVVGFGFLWVVAMLSGVVKFIRRRRAVNRAKDASLSESSRSLPAPVSIAANGEGSYDHPGDSLFGTPVGGQEDLELTAVASSPSSAWGDERKHVVASGGEDGVVMSYFNPLRIRGMAAGAGGSVLPRPASSLSSASSKPPQSVAKEVA